MDNFRRQGRQSPGLAEGEFEYDVGHVINGVRLIPKDKDAENCTFDNANRDNTEMVLCGTAGVSCGSQPLFAFGAQTSMDSVNSIKNSKTTGNIEFMEYFKKNQLQII